jgi:DNA-binding transcriptional LysR family regulator
MIPHELEIFRAVIQYGGFNRASKYLRLSQPAISANIKKLEEDLGIELFERLGRSIQLTDAGKIVEQYTTRLTALLTEVRHAIEDVKGLEAGQLRCGAATTVGIYLLPRVLLQFKKQFPKVETQLSLEQSRKIEERVLTNDLDLGFVNDSLGISSSLETRASITDELVMITPCEHYLARFQKVSPKRLRDLPLILGPKNSYTRKIIEKYLDTAGITYRCVMEVENTEVIKAAVSEGLGLSVISLARIRQEIRNHLLIPVRISGLSMRRNFKLVIHRNRRISAPLRAFLEILNTTGL